MPAFSKYWINSGNFAASVSTDNSPDLPNSSNCLDADWKSALAKISRIAFVFVSATPYKTSFMYL